MASCVWEISGCNTASFNKHALQKHTYVLRSRSWPRSSRRSDLCGSRSHLCSCSPESSLTEPHLREEKQFLKVLDKKPRDYHYCTILKKFNLLNFDSFVFYSDVCLMYKIIHNLAPPPLRGCLAHNGSAGRTRASARGDLVPQYRKTVFGQTAFSVRVVRLWNSLPTNIRSIDRYAVFKINLKHWLLLEQICNH